MASTDSLDRVLAVARTRLLTFVPNSHPVQGTNTIASRLGTATGAGSDGKLYKNRAPDNISYPYGVMRFVGIFTGGDDGGYNIRGPIELQFYGYGASMEGLISSCMDVAEEAWRDWCVLAVNDSIVAQRSYGRAPVPYESDPADRELICHRILLPFYATPQYKAGAA